MRLFKKMSLYFADTSKIWPTFLVILPSGELGADFITCDITGTLKYDSCFIKYLKNKHKHKMNRKFAIIRLAPTFCGAHNGNSALVVLERLQLQWQRNVKENRPTLHPSTLPAKIQIQSFWRLELAGVFKLQKNRTKLFKTIQLELSKFQLCART